MSVGPSVLPLHPVAELCHHRLVVGPLPVVDDQSAGLAGEPLLTHGVLAREHWNIGFSDF